MTEEDHDHDHSDTQIPLEDPNCNIHEHCHHEDDAIIFTTGIGLKGLQSFNAYTIPPEERALAHIRVEVDGQLYDWQIFVPKDISNLEEFLQNKLSLIREDIRSKEIEWQNLNPKTKMIEGAKEDCIEVPIHKHEIVCPDIPDYSCCRRMEYPSIYDQLDALWKGPESQDYINMKNTIDAIKIKHMKPY